jgi:hypothetical protein
MGPRGRCRCNRRGRQKGTITLTGYIDTCSGKLAEERAAKRVRAVRAVANDIEVRLTLARVDADIAADVVLAFCRIAVQAHGGRIWVEDNQPRGSVFVVNIPIDQDPTQAGSSDPA